MIEFEEIPGGFVLSYNGMRILNHTESEPAFVLGAGDSAVTCNHGNYKLTEKNVSQNQCRNYSVIERRKDMLKLHWDNGLETDFFIRNGRLEIDLNSEDSIFNRFTVRLMGHYSEHIYGCGEQYTYLDLKGRKVPLWSEEQGVGRGFDLITFLADMKHDAGGKWYSTYFPQPTFVSSSHYYIHCECSAYAVFDFSKRESHELYFWEIPSKIIIDQKPDAVQLMKSLTDLIGRQPALPEWVFDGIWLGIQGGTEIVREKIRKAEESGVKISGIWIQDWEGKRVTSFGKQLMWNWKYDETLYPDLPALIKEMREKKNIRFLGYINPFLAIEKDLYQEASEKGYLIKDQEGGDQKVLVTTFPTVMLDLTNPDAFEWIKSVIKENMIGIGLSGWMADFAEYAQTDGVYHSGESGELVHNKYPALWAKANYEAVKEAGKLGEIVYFNRSGYTGTSKYTTAMWAGDQLVNWSKDDGLSTVIPAMISTGFSGIGFMHSDIGGYTTVGWIKRSRELLLRWTELAAFSSIMRTHEGNRPDVNHQFDSDEKTLKHFARMTKVYQFLKPYYLSLVKEYEETGLPMVRHPYLHYERDDKIHQFKYQYLLGRDLLVAPVYLEKKKKRKLYLPKDEWIHIWTGKIFKGPKMAEVQAPIGFPPVFYRKDSEFKDLFEKLMHLEEQ